MSPKKIPQAIMENPAPGGITEGHWLCSAYADSYEPRFSTSSPACANPRQSYPPAGKLGGVVGPLNAGDFKSFSEIQVWTPF